MAHRVHAVIDREEQISPDGVEIRRRATARRARYEPLAGWGPVGRPDLLQLVCLRDEEQPVASLVEAVVEARRGVDAPRPRRLAIAAPELPLVRVRCCPGREEQFAAERGRRRPG
jgi:hypothetical protein